MKATSLVPCVAVLCVLATSCGTILRIGEPEIEPWFEADDLVKKRVAVAPHTCATGAKLAHRGFDDQIHRALTRGLGKSVVLDARTLRKTAKTARWLDAARQLECDYLAVVHVEEVSLARDRSTSRLCRKGKTVEETTYTSTTIVGARFEMYRVSDGQLAFKVYGTGCRGDTDSEDDDHDGFWECLIHSMFFSATYPPYPSPSSIADDLAVGLVKALPQVK